MTFGPISIFRDVGGRIVFLRVGRLDLITWWKATKR